MSFATERIQLPVAEPVRQSPVIWRWGCLLVLALSIIPFTPAIQGGPIWEDQRLIDSGEWTFTEVFTRPFLGGYFRPLVTFSFWLDHRLWHEELFMYHQTNVLIHAFTALVLVGLLWSSFRNQLVALLGGLLFAVQPAQVSAVAWIGGRTDSLSTLFAAVFAWTLIVGVRSRARGPLWLSLSLTAYLLALLTKEQVIALVPLVPLAFYCFGQEVERSRRRRLAAGWGTAFAAVSLGFLALAFTMGPGLPSANRHDLVYTLGLFGRTLTYYALLLVTPSAKWMHSVTVASLHTAGITSVLSGFAVLAGVICLFLYLMRTRPPAAWLLALLALALLPVSNIIPIGSLIVAPYRAGLAGLGMAALMGWATVRTAEIHAGRVMGIQAWIGAGALLIWCTGLTAWGSAQWRSSEHIHATLARYDPMSSFAQEGYANSLLATRPDLAQRQLEQLLTLLYQSNGWKSPKDAARMMTTDPEVTARVHVSNGDKRAPRAAVAETLTLLGYAHIEQGNRAQALSVLRVGEAIDPGSGSINLALGRWFVEEGRWRDAVPYLRKVTASNPRVVAAHVQLGRTLLELNRHGEAIHAYQTAISLQPWVGDGYVLLAQAQEQRGDASGAANTLLAGLRQARVGLDELQSKLAELTRKMRRRNSQFAGAR